MHRSARVFWNATREKDNKRQRLGLLEKTREKCAHVSGPETTAREISNAQTDRALDGKTTFAYFPTARGPNDALAFEHISQRPRKRQNFTRAFREAKNSAQNPNFFLSLHPRASKSANANAGNRRERAVCIQNNLSRENSTKNVPFFFNQRCDVVLKLLLCSQKKSVRRMHTHKKESFGETKKNESLSFFWIRV